jgi:hypothetical protein
MRTQHKAQWISKSLFEALRRSEGLRDFLLLETSEGFIVVERAGKNLGDGPILSPEECEYELQPAWYAGPIVRLAEARQRLGLSTDIIIGRLKAARKAQPLSDTLVR